MPFASGAVGDLVNTLYTILAVPVWTLGFSIPKKEIQSPKSSLETYDYSTLIPYPIFVLVPLNMLGVTVLNHKSIVYSDEWV